MERNRQIFIENYIHVYLAEFNLLDDKPIKICTLGFPIILNLPPPPAGSAVPGANAAARVWGVGGRENDKVLNAAV